MPPFQVFSLAGLSSFFLFLFFFVFVFVFVFTTRPRLSKICKAKQSLLIREDLFMDRNEAEILRLKKKRTFEVQIQFYF